MLLYRAAHSVNSSSGAPSKSVFRGNSRRRRPIAFSTPPFRHGDRVSQKNVSVPNSLQFVMPRELRPVVERHAPPRRHRPAFEERVTSLAESITELGPSSITPVLTYYNSAGGDLFVSPDRRATLIQFQLPGDLDDTVSEIGPIYERVVETSGEGGFDLFILGESSFAYETSEIFAS